MLVRCACALTLLCVAARASPDSLRGDKRAEMAQVPFVLGSRYGRSPPRQLTPRNDRFFMGSRYGKRSEPALSLTSLADRAERQAALSALTGRQGALTGRPGALTALTHRSAAPSLLWQAAALLAGRSHRTFDNEP